MIKLNIQPKKHSLIVLCRFYIQISLVIVINITTMNKPIIFVLSILVVGAVADDIHDVMKDVVSLDGDTFYTEVAKKPHFVLFFAPW